ncbi:MAG: PP2C family protein-serine/threonine phosphatase [Myxococcales bacterium]|nr:SpoIIE family protein phosphatase [Myxococcales bacterium]
MTLAPDDNGAKQRFCRYRDALIHDWMKILAILGVVLVPLFLLLDYITMPEELLRRFAMYRGSVTLAVALLYILLRVTRPSRWSFIYGYIFSILVCGMIVLMTVDLGGFSSAYYAGLMLVIFPVNVLLPWRAIHSVFNGCLAVGLYVVADLLLGGPFTSQAIVNNLYFLLSSVVIVVAMSETRYRLIEREFHLRTELEDTNTVLEKSRADLKEARDRLWSEMEVAQRIQTALLPKNRRLGAYEAEATMLPAQEVGGDYYDFLETRHGEHWVAVGDVSGHGVESGLVMMMTQTTISSLVNDAPGRSPTEVFVQANRVIRENVSRLGGGQYMTLNIIRLDDDKLVVAGKHQDLLVWRALRGKVEILGNEGSWIGVVDDVRGATEDLEVPMTPGDCVLLFTDGATEAMNTAGQMFGQARLAEAFGRVAGKVPLREVIAALRDELALHQVKREDDLTFVLLARRA